MLKIKEKINLYITVVLIVIGIAAIYKITSFQPCKTVVKDERSLKEYFVEIDMSGYNDRLFKHGLWQYYRNDSTVAEGSFKNGIPIGLWKYRGFKDGTWKSIEDSNNGYVIHLPNSWDVIENKNFSLLAAFDSKNIEIANVNLVVSDYDIPIGESLVVDNENLSRSGMISELETKKISITEFDEVYQRKYRIKYKNENYLVFQSVYGRKDFDKVYTFTINCKYSEYQKYVCYFEPIISSLKFYGK